MGLNHSNSEWYKPNFKPAFLTATFKSPKMHKINVSSCLHVVQKLIFYTDLKQFQFIVKITNYSQKISNNIISFISKFKCVQHVSDIPTRKKTNVKQSAHVKQGWVIVRANSDECFIYIFIQHE